jgi:tRNA (guanine37-N1)-methyltransferase
MTIQIVTLFPEMFEGVLGSSMLWKAQKDGLVEYELINLRDYGIGPRKKVDDTPYGGGDGMVLRPEPLVAAIEAAKSKNANRKSRVILMTPRGEKFTQAKARQLATSASGLIIICGRYEGYDERVIEFVDEQISIGDYILTGGDIPAMAVVDSVTRLIPGALGGATSAELESFSQENEIEHPHYTRPEEFKGMKVPEVLLSGKHAEIEKWRTKNKIVYGIHKKI